MTAPASPARAALIRDAEWRAEKAERAAESYRRAHGQTYGYQTAARRARDEAERLRRGR